MSRKTVVVADDDELVRETLVDVTQLFFDGKIDQAENGQEALDHLINESSETILITDINMPVMNGYELVEKVLQMDQSIPIIMISGYLDNKALQNMKFPNIKFLPKPVDIDDLKDFLLKCG